jgi:hypothetical protein
MDLDSIRIASPCKVPWEKMQGDNRVRFCSQCALSVYNISAMSRQEAQEFLTASTGRVCGLLYRRADGTILTQDCPKGMVRALKWRAARVAAAILGLLGVSTVSACAGMIFTDRLPASEVESPAVETQPAVR